MRGTNTNKPLKKGCHPGCLYMQKSVSSDLTSLSCKANSSSDKNFGVAEFSGSVMSSRTQVLSRAQLCHLRGWRSSTGAGAGCLCSGLHRQPQQCPWKRSSVLFCLVFSLYVFFLLLKAKNPFLASFSDIPSCLRGQVWPSWSPLSKSQAKGMRSPE